MERKLFNGILQFNEQDLNNYNRIKPHYFHYNESNQVITAA